MTLRNPVIITIGALAGPVISEGVLGIETSLVGLGIHLGIIIGTWVTALFDWGDARRAQRRDP